MKASQYKAQYDRHLRAMTAKYGNPALASTAEKNLAIQLFRAYQQAEQAERDERQAKRR